MYCKIEKTQLAKHEFLSDLSNYVPLGSLTLPISDTDEPLSASEWQESGNGEDVCVGLRQLRKARFARTFARKHQVQKDMLTLRVYVLPCDVGRRFFLDNDEAERRKYMPHLMGTLDCSFKSWEGLTEQKNQPIDIQYYNLKPSHHESLFYLFNTIRSPCPNPEQLSCPFDREAASSLLEGTVRGLRTDLYPFQRRSAATMINREVEPSRSLDPRVELFRGPTGLTFYFDKVSGVLLRARRDYDDVCGGILAETMGYGKTLICLAAILATKGHWPKIPPQYSLGLDPVRPRVATLREMVAAQVGRAQIPWRTYLEDITVDSIKENCLKLLQDNIGSYIIPPPTSRRDQRSAIALRPRRIILCNATLIIVPPNLIHQWTREISLHLEENALKVLLVEDFKTSLPPVNDLLLYDIILMAKNRFEKEFKIVSCTPDFEGDPLVCECPFQNECTCNGNGKNRSPLTNLHFLRIIVDEGHGFVASGRHGNSATWALDQLCVERRWIVSGTPTAGLLGVELDTAAREVSKQEETGQLTSHEATLETMRYQTALLQEAEDVKQLGRIVVNFFKLRPWANSKGDDPASWQKYVIPSKWFGRKPRCLRSILESIVVRHGIGDIEQDVKLPPLYNRRVYVQPSWHDKLSINLFILSLTVNAVTSERTDEDYMFHPSNRSQLEKLVTKLRQSGFYWVGYSAQEVSQTIEIARSYQEKASNGERHCAPEDRILLNQVMEVGRTALSSASWRAFAELHEMGIYVEDFPASHREQWSLVPRHTGNPLLVGATQLSEVQKRVDSNLHSPNPEYDLGSLEILNRQRPQEDAEKVLDKQAKTASKGKSIKTPRRPKNPHSKPKPTQEPKLKDKDTISYSRAAVSHMGSDALQHIESGEAATYPMKAGQCGPGTSLSRNHGTETFPSDSPLAKARIIGTASAKLSYLLDRVIALQREEKILIFYQGDHIAYFIAQAFDLLAVRYLIYTATLGLSRQSAYATTFNTTEIFRVMLMDINQAAHGLNVASASRVFFVNPVWQPNVEAQAIKRAHRIGQKRPVYVESIVLQGTLEDQMLERRKQMSTEEHQKAKKGPIDDPVMGDIIRNARVIPLAPVDTNQDFEMSRLAAPQPLFGRLGQQDTALSDPDADLIFPDGMGQTMRKRRAAKRVRDPELAARSSTSKKARIDNGNE